MVFKKKRRYSVKFKIPRIFGKAKNKFILKYFYYCMRYVRASGGMNLKIINSCGNLIKISNISKVVPSAFSCDKKRNLKLLLVEKLYFLSTDSLSAYKVFNPRNYHVFLKQKFRKSIFQRTFELKITNLIKSIVYFLPSFLIRKSF